MGKKILIIRTSSMGDVVHALPAAYDIRQALPDCELHWAVEESFEDIAALSPFVDRRIRTAFRRWRKHPFSPAVRSEIASLKKNLRGEHYDTVIDMQGLLRSALLAHWTGSPVSGFSRDTVREPLASFFYSEKHRLPGSLTPVPRYRLLAAETLGYEIDSDKARFGLKVHAESLVPAGRPCVAFVVNASSDVKLWPQENWKPVIAEVRRMKMLPVFFWGSEAERARVEELADAAGEAVIVPRSGLAETAATLAGMSAALGLDTGLTHLAAALGVPTVELVFSADVFLAPVTGEGPTASLGKLGQKPSVEEVLEKFHQVLDEARGLKPCGC